MLTSVENGSWDHAGRLRGREAEEAALVSAVRELVAGRSIRLVLSGEAGIGKSWVVDRFAAAQAACRVARVSGVAAERDLSYAGLDQLCRPFLDRIELLPEPQRTALEAVFGRRAEAKADPFLVGVAVLGLLAAAAAERPLLCLVDDAQRLDRASLRTLSFVARRLGAERVGLVFVVRDREADLDGLPEIRLLPLTDGRARELLGGWLLGPVDAEVRERMIAEAQGNPRVLRQLADAQRAHPTAGGFAIPAAPHASAAGAEQLARRMRDLAPDEQRLLLLAAADPTGDPVLLRHAAQHLALPVPTRVAGPLSEMVDLTPRVRFRDPPVRAAVYAAAHERERMTVHLALGAVTDPALPDRKAWHLALGAAAPDEALAARLESCAAAARARGGAGAAGAFLGRAAELTPDPATRARRALDAAHAQFGAGAVPAARELLATAQAGPLAPDQVARAGLLSSRIALHTGRGGRATDLLLAAADDLRDHDPGLSRETYLDALMATAVPGRLWSGAGRRGLGERILRSAPPPPLGGRPGDVLLERWAAGLAGDAGPGLRAAIDAGLADPAVAPRAAWAAVVAGLASGDGPAWMDVAPRRVAALRASGELVLLGVALAQLGLAALLRGRFAVAEASLTEAIAMAETTGTTAPRTALLLLRGWQGAEEETRRDAARFVGEALLNDQDSSSMARHAVAVLDNGLGGYRAALRTLTADGERAGPLALFEVVEAAARSGEDETAARAVRVLAGHARTAEGAWMAGIASCAEALCADGPAAEARFARAIEQLEARDLLPYLGRARLLYGEWLRRAGRRAEARDQLRPAHELLSELGCAAFADRARRELAASGARSRRRRAETRDDLTPQELQIAQMAARGMSNREIGRRLFLSHRTIATHLYRVFPKLGVTSRAQLAEALRSAPGLAVPIER